MGNLSIAGVGSHVYGFEGQDVGLFSLAETKRVKRSDRDLRASPPDIIQHLSNRAVRRKPELRLCFPSLFLLAGVYSASNLIKESLC
jgi:hypothetical protein